MKYGLTASSVISSYRAALLLFRLCRFYTVSQKNDPDVAHYNFNVH